LEELFEDWRAELTSDDLKKYYFEYLKTLPSFDKVKRLDKLDCHNIAFEEFLKNNYLVILERLRREKERSKEKEVSVRTYKSSQKMLHKVYTEGNIDNEVFCDLNNKKIGFSYKETSYFGGVESGKDSMKLKRMGIRGTGKTLEFIDE
jgi:hypothetical protein